MMGRIKYKGSENPSNNNNNSNNNNKNNINNTKGSRSNNGSVYSNGKHRNGGPTLRRSKLPPSLKGKSKSHNSNTIVLAVAIALLSLIVVFLNVDFLNSFFNESTVDSNTTSSGIDSATVGVTSGGWRLASHDVLSKYDPGICTIERISVTDLSPERFESEVRFKKPVLVTFPGGASGWTDPEKWSRDSLVKEYSKWSVRSGESLEIVRKGGNADHKTSFVTFVNRLLDNVNQGPGTDVAEPLNYVFDRRFYWQTKLPKTLRMPAYFKVDRSDVDSIFFLGSSMTGVVFHKHSDTWNGVVYGRKRWFLYPSQQTPPGGVHHGYTVLEWVHNVYPNLTEVEQPTECVQEPGEILYLPEGTYHATLNMGDTVAVAIQKKNAQLETEKLFYEATNLNNLIQETPLEQRKDLRYNQLLDIFKKLHHLLPDNAEVMMAIGDTLHNMGKYTESLEWSQMAVDTEPYFILAYLHLGMTFAKLERYAEAEEQFLNAKVRSPNFWDTYKEYGEFLYNRGRVADALLIYKRGTELKPDLLPFWYFYKVCQEELGDIEGARNTEKMMAELRERES